jgi:hypothetical protein
MEKLSGLVLDVYDDRDGWVVKDIWPTLADVPELVKQAQRLTAEDREVLPDDLYALVLHDGPVTLRKYACADPGNTWLSVHYFLKTAHKLPEEAQKVAASNLHTACGWYALEPPEELKKIALGLGTAVNAGLAATMLPGLKRQLGANRAVIKGAETVLTPAQVKVLSGQ